MIIIKTKNGDRFVNDKAVTMVEHDREKGVVNAYGDKGVFFHIEDVELVLYTNDAQPTSWKDEGSEIHRLLAVIEQKGKEYDKMMEHARFTRECFFVLKDAIEKIASVASGGKDPDPSIVAIIEEAEKVYQGLEENYEKARAKWEE